MLVPRLFVDYHILTTSLKIRRHEVKKVFIKEIKRMYNQWFIYLLVYGCHYIDWFSLYKYHFDETQLTEVEV